MEDRAAGTWPTPVSAQSLAGARTVVESVMADGDDVWWSEWRPAEGGRTAVVCWNLGEATDVSPPQSNVRTSVHEYGGGAWWVHDGALFYVEYADQRLRMLRPGGEPVLLTPEPHVARGLRYADGRVTPDGQWFVCVLERHHADTPPDNELVAVATNGSGTMNLLAAGADFYASPRISPDGRHLVWVQWMHPNMPWDSTELWIGELGDGELHHARMLAGNGDEALQEPLWLPDGSLVVATDRTDWWNLYTVDTTSGALTPRVVGHYDIVEPHWDFGGARHADGVHVVATDDGDHLSNGLSTPFSAITSLRGNADDFVFVGATWSSDPEPVRVRRGELERLRPAAPFLDDPAFFPAPEFITFPTTRGQHAHALFYRPAHPHFCVPAGELPPLVVSVHGGPTSAASRQLQPRHRYYTSRGIAVVDVDYRGSTGYGRTYRNLLRGEWCVIDVDDAVAAASYLADRDDVDRARMAIRGGSAGGTTTLLALANHRVFAAGANYFGVADLVGLMSDDHKFESQYTVQLVGPYPERIDLYRARSPLSVVDRIEGALVVLQGSDDPIVPPHHSTAVVDAMHARGMPIEYHEFAGEGHGFRGTAAIIRSAEIELGFYGRTFGFEPAPSTTG
jgi:dipeptidyl aminopeptidase/acylaminoacyl peptidase